MGYEYATINKQGNFWSNFVALGGFSSFSGYFQGDSLSILYDWYFFNSNDGNTIYRGIKIK